MKFLKIFGSVVILLLICLYVLLFTGFGNGIVKPIAQNMIKEKSGIDVEFDKFDINFGSLDLNATVNKEIVANVSGKYSLFGLKFDLDYLAHLKDLQSFKVKLQEQIDLKGKARGKLNDFGVNGVGNIFGSNLRFVAQIKDKKPQDLSLDAKNLDIEKILLFLNKPIYMRGKIDAVADVKNGSGTANIDSKNAILNEKVFKDMNITIPKDTKVDINSLIKFDDMKTIVADSKIASNLANLSAKKTTYVLDENRLISDFIVDISDLSKLEPIIKQKLSGSLKGEGNLEYKDEKLSFIDMSLKAFGGDVDLHLKDSKLNGDLSNLEVSNLIRVASLPAFANGKLSGKVSIDDIYKTDKIAGNANLNILNGSINQKELAKLSNLELPSGVKFDLKSDIDIKDGLLKSVSNLNSNLLNAKKLVANYDLKNQNADTNFALSIPDLSKFSAMTGANLQGSIDANGEAKLVKNELSSLKAKITQKDGAVDINSDGKSLNANIKNMDLAGLLAMAAQPIYAVGKINGDVKLNNLDFKNLNGNININIANGVLSKPTMDRILKKNFPKNVKFSLTNRTNIKSSVANFTNVIKSDIANLDKFDGSYNLNSAVLDAKFIADIKDLNKLEFITGRKLRGGILVNGDVSMKKNLMLINAYSNFLKGKMVANIKNDDATLNLTDIDVKSLTDLLIIDHIYDGVAKANVVYNIATENGKFDALVDKGKLTPNKMTNLVKTITGRDLTGEIYNNSTLTGTIRKDLVNFKAHMVAQRSELNVTDGKLNRKNLAINIPIVANFEKTDLDILLTGTTQNPKVNVSSKYLEKKLDKVIDKGLSKIFKSDSKNAGDSNSGDDNATNLKEENKDIDTAKEIIKGLKGLF